MQKVAEEGGGRLFSADARSRLRLDLIGPLGAANKSRISISNYQDKGQDRATLEDITCDQGYNLSRHRSCLSQ